MSNALIMSSPVSEPTKLSVGINELSLSSTSTDFTIIEKPQTDSEYDIVSNPGPSEAAADSVDALTEVNVPSPPSLTSTPSTANRDPSHGLTFEEVNLLAIKDLAGGSFKKYKEMIIEELKLKKGLPFTAATAIPRPTEFIGDQLPGYEAMTVDAKLWSWWTQEEKLIFDAHIVTEILQEIKDQQDREAQASKSDVLGDVLSAIEEEAHAVPSSLAVAETGMEKSSTVRDKVNDPSFKN